MLTQAHASNDSNKLIGLNFLHYPMIIMNLDLLFEWLIIRFIWLDTKQTLMNVDLNRKLEALHNNEGFIQDHDKWWFK